MVVSAIGLTGTDSAKRSYRVIFLSELTLNLSLATLVVFNMDRIADLYSNDDQELRALLVNIIPVVCSIFILNAGSLQGTGYALMIQHKGVPAFFFGYWVLALPVGLLLAH